MGPEAAVVTVEFRSTQKPRWCRWWDLNPHAFLRAQDFKSCMSAIPSHRQRTQIRYLQQLQKIVIAFVPLLVPLLQYESY